MIAAIMKDHRPDRRLAFLLRDGLEFLAVPDERQAVAVLVLDGY